MTKLLFPPLKLNCRDFSKCIYQVELSADQSDYLHSVCSSEIESSDFCQISLIGLTFYGITAGAQ